MIPFDPTKPVQNALRDSATMRNLLYALFNGDFSPLRPRAQATPNMTIQVGGTEIEGFWRQIWAGVLVPLNFAGGNSPSITAPSSNPRIALLTINESGTLAWTYGDEAASPIPPNVPSDVIPICWVYERTTMIKIVNYEDNASYPNDGYIFKDVRPLINLGTPTPIGAIFQYPGRTPPMGFLLCGGSAISRITYSSLFSILVPDIGDPSISIASPCVITLNNHSMQIGDSFYLITDGQLPTGLSPNTLYYVISAGFTTNSFRLSATRGGTAINTSGTQNGTHTLMFCPYGLGDGSTTFNLPDLKQRFPMGRAASGTGSGLGESGGDLLHTHPFTMPPHRHLIGASVGGPSPAGIRPGYWDVYDPPTFENNYSDYQSPSGNTGNDSAPPPFITVNFIIKY